MTPSLTQRSAARILDLADPAARPRRPRALAAGALFFVISAFCAHGFVLRGSPDAARAAEMSPAGATNAHAESPEMKQLLSRLSVASAVAVGSSALAQDAVQWRVEDGGNGHWYLPITTAVARPQALLQAAALGGHLATITSSAENQFLASLNLPSLDGAISYWTGGVRADSGYGPWSWITGEAWDYSNFDASEPNGCCGADVRFTTFRSYVGHQGKWDDTSYENAQFVLVEFDADCNHDGVADYGQILAGELEDTNANNIPDCCEAGTACGCSADISGNGTVDAVDLAAVLSSWGNAPTGKVNADVNRDGIVDAIDLAEVLGAWGACP